MPTVRLPLVGTYNTRGLAGTPTLTLGEDQRFLNTTFEVVQNPLGGRPKIYAKKRPGWMRDSLVSTGLAATGIIKPQLFNAPVSAFGEANSAVYLGSINIGNITGRALHFTETLVSATTNVMIKASDGTGWYYVDGAKNTLTYTGFTSSGLATVSTIADTTGIYPGQLVTGNTIGNGARVSTVNAATSTITLTANNTGNSTGAIITKEPIAKILGNTFIASSTYISAFAPMDGYLFYATDDGYINNSDLNSVTAYTALGRLAVQGSPDPAVGVAIQKNYAIVFGTNSKEAFHNAGNAAGSPLTRIAQYAENIGCVDQRSVTKIEDEIYFVGSPADGDLGIYKIKGLASQKVSTPVIDRILGTYATSGAIYASSFKLGGYSYAAFSLSTAADAAAAAWLQESSDFILLESGFHILTEDTAAQTASFVRRLVYNVQLNIWSEWDDVQATFIDSIGTGTANQLYATSRFTSTGAIYRISPLADGELFQDDSSTYSMEIRTSKIDLGTQDVKIIEEVELICDTQSTGSAFLSYSDDDYQTWSTPRELDLSSQNPRISRLGSHRGGRAYKITHSSNAAFRGEAMTITYRVGVS